MLYVFFLRHKFNTFLFFISNFFPAIKNALKQENLNPEIEEKLLQLQRYQEKQMKGGTEGSLSSNQNHSTMTTTVSTTPRAPARKRPAPQSSANTTSSTPTTTNVLTPSQNSTPGAQASEKNHDWAEPARKRVPPNRQEHREVSRFVKPSFSSFRDMNLSQLF